MSKQKVKRKYAPCCSCDEMILRDEMYSMNVKFYDPCDTGIQKIQTRLCEQCRDDWFDRIDDMRWDNSSMVEVVEEIEYRQFSSTGGVFVEI